MAEVSSSYFSLPSELLLPKPKRYHMHTKAPSACTTASKSDASLKNQLLEEISQIIYGKRSQNKLDTSSTQWKPKILVTPRSSNPIIEDELFKEFDKEMSP
ncbi:unnamed protein product [Blepharisma stoltei]|uniref:Uncharacterized protein n=1 Tax=Blepharisma stoltei TaxID=1481888 RepID=A0AAU9IU16_9CILI|nr:unnamed protein product [Blepharisma stoltei]